MLHKRTMWSHNFSDDTKKLPVLTTKFGRKLKCGDIRHSVSEKKLNIGEKSKDDTDRISKGYCFSIVHSGVNDMHTNEAILRTYTFAFDGKLLEKNTLNILCHHEYLLLLPIEIF